jgi:hypothetical protein
MASDEVRRLDSNVATKKSDLDAHDSNVKDALNEGKAAKMAYDNTALDDPKRVEVKQKLVNARTDYQAAEAEQTKAKGEYDAAIQERASHDNNHAIKYNSKAQDDGVQYNLTNYWSKDGDGGGHWVTTYHCNAADKDPNAANWWKDYGKDIEKGLRKNQ